MRLLKFILFAISCFELKIFALQRTSILTIDLPIQIDVKSESSGIFVLFE